MPTPRPLRSIAPLALLACAALACARGPGGSTPRTGVADVNGARLAYELRGDPSARPTVVLVHGGGFDRRLWDREADALDEDFAVLRYDVRGSGGSTTGSGKFQHHEDLATLLARLGIPRASIVGQSLGGRIAVDLALTHPALVERLVLVGPGLSGWDRRTAGFGPWIDAFRDGLRAGGTTRAIDAWLASDYMKSAASRADLRATLVRWNRDNAKAWFWDVEEPELAPPALPRLAEIRAPTLVIVGSTDERVIQRIADSVVAKVPGARRVVIEGAGHAPNLEAPERFVAVVRAFLARRP